MPSNAGRSPLGEVARNNLIDSLLGAGEFGLRESLNALTDYPQFVASNDTTPPHLALGKAITRQVCRRYARGGGPGALPGFNLAWGPICEPYLDSIGENPEGGALGPEFSGGQCSDVYTISYTLNPNNPGQTTGFLQARGPIAGIRAEQAATESWIATLGCHGLVLSGSQNCRSISNQGFAYRNIGGANAPDEGPGPRINSVTPCGLDNCGNTPATYLPPRVPPGLPPIGPINVDLPGIGPVAIDVEFSPTGNVDVSLPDVGIDFTIEDPLGLGGDEGQPVGGPPPGDVGDPGDPVTPGAGGEAEGVAPEGSVLVGVRVELLGLPLNPNRYTESVYRGAYYVYMGVPGLLDHDTAGAMATSDQFIFAEQPNLTAWRVRANSNYSIRVTPYYRSAGDGG